MRHGRQGRMRPCHGAVHVPPRRTAHVPSGSTLRIGGVPALLLECGSKQAGSKKRDWRRPPNVGGMNLSLSTCFVLVHDPDGALAFYRDVLGLELRNDVARGEYRWITVGAGSQPDVAIVLTNYLNGSPADSDALAALLAKGALNGVHFHTDNLDGAFEQLRAAGAEIVQEPTDQPWGTRDCAVRDPSGNMVRIDQPPAGS